MSLVLEAWFEGSAIAHGEIQFVEIQLVSEARSN